MSKYQKLNQINEYLSRWLAKIELNNAFYFYDINKVAEDIASDILNIVYDLNLSNLNHEQSNFPSIDLGDKTSGIAFQVTSRTDLQKIKDTLASFDKKGYIDIFPNGINFLILNNKEISFGKSKLEEEYSFFKKSNIIYLKDISQKIEKHISKNPEKINELLLILINEFEQERTKVINSFIQNENIISSNYALEKELHKFINITIPNHLNAISETYSNYKTFLHRDGVKFYDTYFPLTIENTSVKKNIELGSIDNLFRQDTKISIIGQGGSGKSTLIRHIFFNTIDTFFAIPIVVELRDLNNKQCTIFEHICQTCFFGEHSFDNNKIIHEFFKTGKLLFLFDGYDEIYSNSIAKVVYEIRTFITNYNSNKFIITSRFGTDLNYMQGFSTFTVSPLNSSQITEFVTLQVPIPTLRNRILETIAKEKNNEYKEYLNRPLLLSMFIYNFENFPEIPKRKSKFYSNVFNTLCQQHDGLSKQGFTREKLSKLQQDDFETILKQFSFVSYFKGEFNFSKNYLTTELNKIKNSRTSLSFDVENLIQDLEQAISILIKDGNTYRFIHRSIQEYFAASFIADLPIEAKKEVYEEHFHQFSSKGEYQGVLLQRLCLELDKNYFLSFYLLPIMKKFLDKIIGKDDNETFKNLVTHYNVSYSYSIYKEKLSYVHVHQDNTEASKIYNFWGIPPKQFEIKDLSNYLARKKYSDKKQTSNQLYNFADYQIGDWCIHLPKHIHNDNGLLTALKKAGVYARLMNSTKQIEKAYHLYKGELKEMNDNFSSIINTLNKNNSA